MNSISLGLRRLLQSGWMRSENAPTQIRARISPPWTFARGIVVILAFVSAIQLATLRTGQEWGDDFALYIRHAQNLVEGKGYADTGYIYNPAAPVVSPRMYPPLFPLLLAPIYWACGLNFMAMKMELVLIFLVFVFVISRGFRGSLSEVSLLFLAALVGLHPYFAWFKNSIVSDLPFTLFAFLALFQQDKLARRDQEGGAWVQGLCLGLCMYLAYATRTVGVVLAPTVLMTELIQKRKWTGPTLLALGLFVIPMAGQAILLPGGASYLDQMGTSWLGIIAANCSRYAEAFFDMWGQTVPRLLRISIVLPLGAFAVVGFVGTARQRIRCFHTFGILYTIMILVWPSYQAGRFLVPLLPLFLYFAIAGCQLAGAWLPRKLDSVPTIAMGLLAMLGYLAAYTSMDRGPILSGIDHPAVKECFAFVRDSTPPDAVFLFTKPRALALLTGRSASVYHTPSNDAELWAYSERIGAQYIIVAASPEIGFSKDRTFLAPFLARSPHRWTEVFNNHSFRIVRLSQPNAEREHAAADPTCQPAFP